MSERTSKVGGPTRNNEVAVVVADSLANLAALSSSRALMSMIGYHESGFFVTGTSSFPQYWFIPGENSPCYGPPLRKCLSLKERRRRHRGAPERCSGDCGQTGRRQDRPSSVSSMRVPAAFVVRSDPSSAYLRLGYSLVTQSTSSSICLLFFATLSIHGSGLAPMTLAQS